MASNKTDRISTSLSQDGSTQTDDVEGGQDQVDTRLNINALREPDVSALTKKGGGKYMTVYIIMYLVPNVILFVLLCASIINLSIANPSNVDIWKYVLCSLLGIIVPSPVSKLKKLKDRPV